MDNEQFTFLDIISIVSFLVGIENLELNNKQANQLEEHLNHQDDKLLSTIIEQNNKIIKLLEGLCTKN